MTQIETLAGPLGTDRLGTVLMHEHLYNLTAEIQVAHPGFNGWDPDAAVERARGELTALKELGVDTMLELSVIGLGRDIDLFRRSVEGTGMQVIVSTGLYTYDVLPRPWHFIGPGTLLDGPEPMDELFQRDIEEGIGGTDVKAGMLKCAVDAAGATDHVERVVRSVCRVHHETNTPLTVHTHAPTHRGRDVLRLLGEEGVDPSRVVLAHCGDTTETDYLEELIDAGALLGMDRFGLDILLPFEDRVRTVAALCDSGYADRMVLSHDASVFTDWFPPGLLEQATPKWHYRHIHEDVLPALRDRGVTDDQLETMLVDTPRRFFERG